MKQESCLLHQFGRGVGELWERSAYCDTFVVDMLQHYLFIYLPTLVLG